MPGPTASNLNALRPLVIKLGGAAIDDGAGCAALWDVIASMHSEAPGSVVLVHGGGAAVDRRLARLGVASERIDGIRVTTPEIIDEVVATLAGSISATIVGELVRRGAGAVGLLLSAGGFAQVVKTRRYAFDAGRVGEVVGGDAAPIRAMLEAGLLPVLCSIGLDAEGLPLNVNADEAAAGAAGILGARALALLTDVDGVLDASGEVIGRLTPSEVEERIASGEIHGGMIPKVRGALDAARAAGAPCVIASWKRPENLRAIARGVGVGTWLTTDDAPARMTEVAP